ncbi:MAG: glycosyltransferase family 4 protein [Robiginitomaculum sp.]|nr:glycosyltransferase family 4 protein [Robiginitomaculum sp.]
MGLLADIYVLANLKMQTAKVKKKDDRALRFLQKVMLKSDSLQKLAFKKAQQKLSERFFRYTFFDNRKKRFMKSVARRTRTEQVEIVLAHDLKAVKVARKFAKRNNAVFFFDLVESTFSNLAGLQPTFFYKKNAKQAERIAAQADYILSGDPYLSSEFVKRQRTKMPVLVLNGQDEVVESRRVISIRERIADNTNRPIVLYIGVVSKLRGIEQIIDAFSLVNTDALLVIMGPGGDVYREEILAQIRLLGLENRAFVLEGVPERDMVPVSATATIGISPILSGTGNAGLVYNNKMFQYLAAHLPILTTNCPGPGGFVKEHEIGYVYEEANATDLAKKIDLALSKDKEFNLKIQNNLPIVARKYAWATQENNLRQLIRSAEQQIQK